MAAYMPQAKTVVWSTPPHIISSIQDGSWFASIGEPDHPRIIGLDPAADESNSVGKRFYDEIQDGLNQTWEVDSWNDEIVFVNPPYGRGLGHWIDKAILELTVGRCHEVVMLLPARPDTKWFHRIYKPSEEDRIVVDFKIDFIKGRLRYGDGTQPAPFGSMLVLLSDRLK